ncbi:zinc transporter ZIP10 isoform X3 [Pristis pectinata]|nr:zinc transporter ZIP10 isoform X3 [Pristis pectinata]XP_051867085.1 zinc transporter ZIP10 isoform X3 [Pristis pectinata]XP_051867093.1 zinc transporter ZIP10 isoform X3 [Pristis pectinata]
MKVHLHTKFCFICLLTFLFHHCNHCHDDHDHERNHDHNTNHVPKENHIHKHNDYQISQESYLQNSPSKSSVHNAVNRQIYYIHKLFSRYGESGKLTFHGFEKLLSNLGLGEVKVVELDHEHNDHDHVSHLDLLEILEHKHEHSHSDFNHTTHEQSVPVPKVNVKHCKNSDGENIHTTTPSPVTHHQPHHHHHHHRGTGHAGGSQIHKEGEQLPDPSDPNAPQHQAKKRSKKRKKHKGVAKQSEMTLTPPPGEFLSIMSKNEEYTDEHFHLPDEEMASQNRRRKDLSSSNLNHEDHVQPKFAHEECLNVSQLLQSYGLSTNSGISTVEFTYLCPALLYQIDSRVCIHHPEELRMEPVDNQDSLLTVVSYTVWIWGLVSITIISLLSVLGVVLVPIINQVCFKYLLTFLVALAVGTLSGDALLHLMPHSQGKHDHSHHDHDHDHNHTHGNHESSEDLLIVYNGLWKGLTALGGIYLLFIVEHCIGLFRDHRARMGKKKWRKQKVLSGEAAVGRKLSDHKLNRRSESEWLDLQTMSGTEQQDGFSEQHDVTQLTDLDGTLGSPSKASVAPDLKSVYIHDSHSEIDSFTPNHESKTMSKKHHSNSAHHSHGHCHSNKEMQDAGIANIAWMVIMGDGMHNFSDGLAIGAAFSASVTGGLSTSIAVFCHELPHELGDFAVLINAGMSVKQAIVYNLMSALLAYVGVVIGIAVGQYTHNLTQWIFAITAGMFLYVALVDMLPEMLHRPTDNRSQAKIGHFALQNAGMLCGFAIMLLIAIFEDQIVIHF